MTSLELQDWLGLWGLLGTGILAVQWRYGRASGLVSAYFLELLALHWIAAAIYLVPGYRNLDLGMVTSGLRISTYALLGFTIGAAWVTWRMQRDIQKTSNVKIPPTVDRRVLVTCFAIGLASYLAIPIAGGIATVSSVVSAGSGFVVIGLALQCWNASVRGDIARLAGWLALAAALPFVTIAVQGFIGYGLAAAAVVFAFVSSFYRISLRTVAVGLVGLFLGLSLYVTYMRDREDIRTVVWGGSEYTDRLDRMSDTFTDFEFFNPGNVEHLWRIDIRLNQNYMVGIAAQRLERRQVEFAAGTTVVQAGFALIPRVLWPDKPLTAGSGDLVSHYTGIRFAEGTSVGIGQVMEWYINFGSLGVVAGFFLFGATLAYLDIRSELSRREGDWASFAQWFLPGIAMLQVGGSLVEVTASAGAAAVVARLAATLLRESAANRRARVTD